MSKSDLQEIRRLSITAEHDVILKAIALCYGHKGKAAKLLNIDRKTLYNKINRYKKEILNETHK